MQFDPTKQPNPASPHDDWRVTAYAFGQLDGDDLAEFEALLAEHESYRQAVNETQGLVSQLEHEARADEAIAGALHEQRRGKLLASMQATAEQESNESVTFDEISPRRTDPFHSTASPHRSRNRLWAGLAVAASAAAVAGVLYYRPSTLPETVAKADPSLDSREANTTDASQLTPESSHNESAPVNTASANTEPGATEEAFADDAAQTIAELENAPTSEPDNNHPFAVPSEPFSQPLPATLAQQGSGTVPAGAEAKYGDAYGGADVGGYGYGGDATVPASSAGGYAAGGSAGMGAGGSAGSGAGMARTPEPSELSVAGSGGYGAPEERGDMRHMGGMRLSTGGGPGIPATSGYGAGMGYGEGRGVDKESLPDEAFYRRARRSDGGGDSYAQFNDNVFESVSDKPLSTFSIDVDTASYSKVRAMLNQYGRLPSPDAVRIEEFINYFKYDYPQPEDTNVPFAAAMELADCPWNDAHRLARIAIKGREVQNAERKVSNLVFLLDVSGSMNEANKLPLVRSGLEMLVRQLGENDRVAIVVYAGAAGVVLDSTTADHKDVILESLDRLQAGGSTNGGQGIQLAYQLARDHFIQGGTNRVILCTDGDFNVGTTGTDDLVSMVEREAKGGVFLTVLGFGTGNLNDAMLEGISGKGDGNYAFIDDIREARKVLVEQLTGTLETIAKNVKIQVEFNPKKVQSYRLIGYENRVMAARDFNDDTKDAGEIGAGHTVTALYEIVPTGGNRPVGTELRYQPQPEPTVEEKSEHGDELLLLKLRYMQPDQSESQLLEFPIVDEERRFEAASSDFRFAAAVAGFGMLLRKSPHAGDATYQEMRKIARDAISQDPEGLKAELLSLIETADRLDPAR